MKVTEMSDKLKNNKGNFKARNLDEVVSGGSSEDFVQDGDLVKIIEESKDGFYDERFGKNAVFVIMERCVKKDDGTIEGTGEAVQINLSAFDRNATPYRKEKDGFTVRDGETVRADGDAVTTWKAAKSAKVFMENNMGKVMKFSLKNTVNVRAWDRAAEAYSKTDLREQKVYTITWAA
jgi:hypothetical protein